MNEIRSRSVDNEYGLFYINNYGWYGSDRETDVNKMPWACV